jgi:hypothetical protein
MKRLQGSHLQWSAVVGLSFVTACTGSLLSPHDEEVFPDTTDTIPFSGVIREAERPVDVQAANPDGSGWVSVFPAGSIVSGSRPVYVDDEDVSWYGWGHNAPLQAQHWRQGITSNGQPGPHTAVVRGRWQRESGRQSTMLSVGEDWGTCATALPEKTGGSRKHQGGPRCAGGLLLDPSGVDG